MESLTPKQAQLLVYIKARIEADNVAPSYEEMKTHLNLRSASGIHRLVHGLKDRGHISIKPGARRIKVLS